MKSFFKKVKVNEVNVVSSSLLLKKNPFMYIYKIIYKINCNIIISNMMSQSCDL